MNTLIQTITTSLITFFILGFCFLNYTSLGITPLGGGEEGMLGATVTTIQGTDKLKDSRAVINTNFANLNTDKLEISDFVATTSLDNITTLNNLVTVGTITTGTWNADTLTVANGGTGSTTLLSSGVLYGNGTNAIKAVPVGANDQVLTLVAGAPSWQSGSVNEALDYDWTGVHTWTTGTTTFNSASDFNATTTMDYLEVDGYKVYGDLLVYTPSENLEFSHDAEVSDNTGAYVKKKDIKINFTGDIRIKFDIKSENAGTDVYGRVYINETAIGTEQTTQATSYSTKTEDIQVRSGDNLQLYIKGASGIYNSYVENFRLYYDKTSTSTNEYIIL